MDGNVDGMTRLRPGIPLTNLTPSSVNQTLLVNDPDQAGGGGSVRVRNQEMAGRNQPLAARIQPLAARRPPPGGARPVPLSAVPLPGTTAYRTPPHDRTVSPAPPYGTDLPPSYEEVMYTSP